MTLALFLRECQKKPNMTPTLDSRSRAILREIIRVHVDTGLPVSSRTLFKSSRFDLSPASIRNIMADLTDNGFLVQPHTSAGRIPTDRAYRVYIDELMRHRKIAVDLREQVDSDLASAGGDVVRLFEATSRLLAQLAGEVGFVVAPDELHTVLKSLRFLGVAPHKILVVQVNEPDVVISRVLETEVEYAAEELEAASERLTREYGGRTLHAVRKKLIQELEEEQAACDRIFQRSRELARFALEKSEGEDRIYVDGTMQLLEKREFSDVETLKGVLRAFDEKARLLSLFARYLEARGACVVLGSEEQLTDDPRLSAVLTSYGSSETLTGTLGVIGPARREYPRVIPVVELLGRALSTRLEGAGRESVLPAGESDVEDREP